LQDESFRSYLDELGLNLVRPKRVKTPLLVIGAADDMVIPQKGIQASARVYGTTAVIFPNMAHDVMLEGNWQAVADCILEFLKERGL
jgi:pimeloyl-ACP methyl ester carboxylesterase